MVIMDAYYSPDRLQEIWQNIDHLHLSYLEMEESPEKLDHRMRLEDCIRDFLCMASHSQKFFLRETAEVLHRSASSKKDFSGYKAATGWNAIQLYAGNLLSQPWRKEYRQIKTYCGFYKHQIEANLVGAELMFEAMGYKHYSNGILILEGPICPDTVTSVSKDCLIAYAECQILKAIWEEISPTFKISWLEVLEFRKSHLCSPEQSIRALTYQYHKKQYQAQQNSDVYGQPPCHPSSFPTLTPYNHVPVPVQVPYACPNNYTTYAHIPYPLQYAPHVIKPPYTNGYYGCNGYMGQTHPPMYGYTVPTGQLIELDHSYDAVDRPKISKNLNHDVKLKEKVTHNNLEKSEVREDFEDWDYVYKDLESQGYSKDLGERGDILSPPAKPKKPTNLDEAMNNLGVTDRPLKIVEALDKYEAKVEQQIKNKNSVERKQSQSSSYENLTDIKKLPPCKSKVKTLPPPKENKINNVQDGGNKSVSKKNRWECKTCTYLNENNKDICEMCSKSKVNVEQQMEIGGPQCSKCTLVNSKDTKVCQVCGASLKDSPTYI